MKRYWKIWKQLAACAVGSTLSSRLDSSSYLLGKLIRFGFFLALIAALFGYTDTLVGYGKYETILFFLTFNLADVFPQAFMRGIYNFRHDVRQGMFDFVLVKPVQPLFYILAKFTDILDMIFLLPTVALIAYAMAKLPGFGPGALLLYLLYFLTGQLIILGIHVLVAGLTVRTAESDNAIWLFRESMSVGRFPPEVFNAWLRPLFTWVMPVFLIVAVPAKAYLGLLSLPLALGTLCYALVFLGATLWWWGRALRTYQSASS